MTICKLVLIIKILILHLVFGKLKSKNRNKTLYNLFNFENLLSNNENKSNLGPTNNIDNYIDNMKSQIIDFFIQIVIDPKGHNNSDKGEIIHLVEKNKNCMNFIGKIFDEKRYFIDLLAIKLLRGGIISNAIGLEDECLGNDEAYMFISGEYSYDTIKKNLNSFSNEHILFIESLFYHEEICLWKYCCEVYQPILEYLINNYNDIAKLLFTDGKIKIEGTNYYINKTKNKETYYNYSDLKNDKYIHYLNIIIIVILIFIGVFTFITIFIENKDSFNDKNKNSLNIDSISLDSLYIGTEEKILIAKEKTYKDNNCYKFMLVFNIFKNFLLLNEKKEPLSNQNSLIELSLIRLIIILLIMFGENTYIILKYVDKGRSLYTIK